MDSGTTESTFATNDETSSDSDVVDGDRRKALFSYSKSSLQFLGKICSDLGSGPVVAGLLEELPGLFPTLNDIDHITVAVDKRGETEAEIADDLKAWLDADSNRSALALVPAELLDLAWTSFYSYNVEVLVNPDNSDIISALLRFGSNNRSYNTVETVPFGSLGRAVADLAGQISNLSRRIGSMISDPPGESVFLFDTKELAKADNVLASLVGASSDNAEIEGRAVETGRRQKRPSLPDPLLVRKLVHQRRLRDKFFDPELFSDPAWDMLLDLTIARAEHRRVSVSSLCIASNVPPTTALRWIKLMVNAGLTERIEDDMDRRRAFIVLTDKGAQLVAQYFHEAFGPGTNAH